MRLGPAWARGAALAAVGVSVLLLLWLSGGFQVLAWWIMGLQRQFQSVLGTHVASLRNGEPGALMALLGLCGLYGFLHAVGPGHGKMLVGGAAVGTGATARRMAAIAAAGSLGQSLVAILLVYGGLFVVGATARATVATSEAWALPAGHAAVAAIGAWFLVRGISAWRRQRRHAPHSDHRHGAAEQRGCGHDHGPDAQEVAAARGLSGALALVAAMAARPCSGAMMLLAVAWGMGLAAAGAVGVLAMGVGTASFTIVVAWLAVLGRDRGLAWLSGGLPGGRLMPALQVLAGLVLMAAGGGLLVSSLA